MKTFVLSILSIAGLLMAMPSSAAELSVGDTAPDFTLQASDGKTYKLSQFKGKQPVVVAWFPAAFTRGCTIECKSLAENSDKIRQFNVSYFMASVDPLEGDKGNKAFAEAQKADFPLSPARTASSTKRALRIAGRSTSTRMGRSPRLTRRSSRRPPPRTCSPSSRNCGSNRATNAAFPWIAERGATVRTERSSVEDQG
jgi:peroxiredoxin Q/BCP